MDITTATNTYYFKDDVDGIYMAIGAVIIVLGMICCIGCCSYKYRNKKRSQNTTLQMSNRAHIPTNTGTNDLANDLFAESRRMEQQAIEMRQRAAQLQLYTARQTGVHNINSVSDQNYEDLPPSYESVVLNIIPSASSVNVIR